MDRRGRARSFRRVASPGVEVETAGSAAIYINICSVASGRDLILSSPPRRPVPPCAVL